MVEQWRLGASSLMGASIITGPEDDPEVIAEIVYPYETDGWRQKDEERAHLIAAAPELLEALEKALEIMNYMGDKLNGMDVVTPEDEAMATPIWEKVQAAIAKTRPTP